MGVVWEQLRLVRSGFLWCRLLGAIALPLTAISLFYALVGHVWLSLGRWPDFGETLPTLALRWHYNLVGFSGVVTFGLFWAMPLVFLLCAIPARARAFAVYPLCYCALAALSFWLTRFAPGPFLNWFWD